MKTGDLVILKDLYTIFQKPTLRIVKRVEKRNNWVYLFGCETPYQMSLWRVISEDLDEVG